MARSIITSAFILLCAAIIESSILSNINFLFVVPDLVLICSIYFSLLNGKSLGVTNGFISGVILDFLTGIPFGFNCLLRTIIGYVYGFFSKTLLINGIVVPIFTVGAGTILKKILMYLISIFYPNVNIYITGIISYEFLFEFIVNILLAPIIFKFLGIFRKYLVIKSTEDKVDNVQ